MKAFWDAIVKSAADEKDEASLSLPPGVPLFDSHEPSAHAGSKLFVRKCYPRLARALFDTGDAILKGTPGTGKTLFRNYYMRYIVKHCQGNLVIILHSSAPTSSYYFFTCIDGQYDVYEVDNFKDAYATPVPSGCPAWYLVDVVAGDASTIQHRESPVKYPFCRVIFTSPNEDVVKRYKSLAGPPKQFIMPLWVFKELKEANDLLPEPSSSSSSSSSSQASTSSSIPKRYQAYPPVKLSLEVLKARFELYGGIVRAVLGNAKRVQGEHAKRVEDALALFNTQHSAIVGKTTDSKLARHSSSIAILQRTRRALTPYFFAIKT